LGNEKEKELMREIGRLLQPSNSIGELPFYITSGNYLEIDLKRLWS